MPSLSRSTLRKTSFRPLPSLVFSACLIVLVSSSFLPFQVMAQDDTNPFATLNWLTPAQQDWLREHRQIRLAPAPDFPPVEFFDSNGKYRGISADYIHEIESMLGVHFDIVQYPTWNQIVAAAQQRDIDVWPEAAETQDREAYMEFTRPYLELPAVIISRSDRIGRTTMADLSGKKVAVVEGYAIHDWVSSQYPKVQIVAVPNIEEGLRLVSYGEADAIIEANAPAIFYIEKNGFTNLHVAGKSGFSWHLAMAVRKDWAPLRDILQKAIERIPADRKADIFHSWVSLKQYGWTPSKSLLFALGALFVMVFAAVVLAWNRSLKRVVELRTLELEQRLKDVEDAQRASYLHEKSFNLLFNAVDIPLALHELDGRLIALNDRALSLFAMRTMDLEHVEFPRDFVPPATDMSALVESWQRVVSGQPERFALLARAPGNGALLKLAAYCQRVKLSGRDAILSCLHPEEGTSSA